MVSAGTQSIVASQAPQGSPLRHSRSAAEPLQPLACSFSQSPAASSPIVHSRAASAPYKLPDAFGSLAGLSLAGSSPSQSSAYGFGKTLFEVEVDGGSRQASAASLNFKAVGSPATPVAIGGAGHGASQVLFYHVPSSGCMSCFGPAKAL